MSEPGGRFWELFFEVYESLPRQGPGNRASARRCSDDYAYEFFVTRRPRTTGSAVR